MNNKLYKCINETFGWWPETSTTLQSKVTIQHAYGATKTHYDKSYKFCCSKGHKRNPLWEIGSPWKPFFDKVKVAYRNNSL